MINRKLKEYPYRVKTYKPNSALYQDIQEELENIIALFWVDGYELNAMSEDEQGVYKLVFKLELNQKP